MDIVAVWLIDFFSFLQDCGMHGYVGHTLPVTHYLFTLFLVSKPVMIALGVYRASHVCGDVCQKGVHCAVVRVCKASLDDGEYFMNKAGLDVGIISSVCGLPKTPRLSLKANHTYHAVSLMV
jgi:hypothetical protein